MQNTLCSAFACSAATHCMNAAWSAFTQTSRCLVWKFDCAAVDLRLREGTAAIDAGEVLPGFNDSYTGKAPDLGAYELGSLLPQYGPRPEKNR